ncbi:MAG: PD40 domain-containing protein [Lewinellaceae bacterium]|nr:PD40 domain-containing protein [Lewinellaceae bacterium]
MVKWLCIGLFCCVLPLWGIAQPLDPAGLPKKAARSWEKAREAVNQQAYGEALQALDELLVGAPQFPDGWALKADILHDQGKYVESVAAYDQAFTIDPGYDPRVYYRQALALSRAGEYDRAITALETYLSRVKPNAQQRQRAERNLADIRFTQEAVKHPVPFQPERLGAAINTAAAEYLPAFTADENLLIFTRVVNGQEDFYFSRRQEDGSWAVAQPLEALNSTVNEGAHAIAADGRMLVFTACNQRGGLGSCDLYIAFREGNGWSQPRNMGAPVNTAGWESQPSLAADGRRILFAAKRNDGLGGSDLWETVWQGEKGWSAPRNLGAVINTPEDEQAPFLHPDGRTLYFMSNGHPGLGGFDLYVSRLDSAGQWGKPVNLGYPINTAANEGALTVSRDGQTAYFATDNPDPLAGPVTVNLGEKRWTTDIFQFPLYAAAQPTPVTYARGKVLDEVTRKPLAAIVEITDLGTQQLFYRDRADENGEFLVCLPAGNNYALNIQQPGYLFYSDNFALEQGYDLERPFLLTALLQPLPPASATPTTTAAKPAGKPVILRNVFFATNSATLDPASTDELNRLAQLLREQPQLRIQLNGHTDDVGSESDNQVLSEARARAVMQYLVNAGIAANRLQARGFGESLPIAPNDTPEGRRQNRRTEFVVLE